ncbi:lymphotoxin-alpha-like isoform X2 [Mobula hypostoma]|uniref:lymphotoxin-alpha-like isoform X2 n=1 Tax=Mobula hypostoma TaxID=723540 RepID=UPI002FC3588E
MTPAQKELNSRVWVRAEGRFSERNRPERRVTQLSASDYLSLCSRPAVNLDLGPSCLGNKPTPKGWQRAGTRSPRGARFLNHSGRVVSARVEREREHGRDRERWAERPLSAERLEWVEVPLAADCKPHSDYRPSEGGTDEANHTRQQFTLPTPAGSQPPHRTDPYKGDPTRKLPIAHIIALEQLDNRTVKWGSTRMESSLQGMDYKDGFIIVLEAGHYYVYAQVSFVGPNCSDISEVLESKVLYQQHSSHKALELMEATQSACERSNKKSWYQSIRQGGVFLLAKGTRLFLKISPLSRAEMEYHKTYFGAFKIQ